MNTMLVVFFVLVFTSVFLLLRATTAELISRRGSNRDLRRILETDLESEDATEPRFLRRPRLDRLSNLQKAFERRSEFDALRRLSDQAGLEIPMYRLFLYSMVLAGVTFSGFILSPLAWWIAATAAVGAAAMPVLGLLWLRSRRISKIDMQLADAVDMVKRSLRAGNPLVSTFRLVSNNMNDPIAREFGITAADLSYGNDPRSALLAMLERVPSVSLHGFVTAILVQRETGGNLAETLDHISEVIRQRFRFERKLRTLSAEGRLSAWILIAVPFALAAVLHFTSPNYLGRLLDDPRGPTLLLGGAVLMTIGVIWIRRISRVVI
jgi:tight adherence protein B